MSIRPASPADALAIAPHMREDDSAELFAILGEHPVIAVAYALHMADDAWALERDGEVVGLFGCREIEPGVGQPWLMIARPILAHRKALLRCGRAVIARWHRRWPLLVNWSWCGSAPHHRLLKHLGFTFINIQQIGPLGSLAYEHVRIREWLS